MVWQRFGEPRGYIEPFFGSGAILLGRPHKPGIETANELDPYVANFWRAVQADPEGVAHYADWPICETDLHARHKWLVRNGAFRTLMETDPDYYDAKVAGWWAWGLSMWIGGEWCSRRWWSEPNPWRRRPSVPGNSAGQGIQCTPDRRRPHISGSSAGQGVSRQLHKLSGNGNAGLHASPTRKRSLIEWMYALQDRLRRVRFCCGDWLRVVSKPVRKCDRVTAIFLDPPYSHESGRSKRAIYGSDDFDVAHQVATWAAEHGEEPKLRIALCGLEGEHEMPDTWDAVPWRRPPGYGNTAAGLGAKNADREVICFSPRCLKSHQMSLGDLS